MKPENIDPRLFDLLDELKLAAPRNSHSTARGRAQFLREAVSLHETRRHSGWMIFPFKETLTMKLIVSTLVIVGLLFGGSATVSAAQDDLPNQSLYRVKLMREDVDLWFASDPIQEINILIDQAQTRFREMEMLAAQGIVPPADVQLRAQERIQRALQLAAHLDDTSRSTVSQQIQTRLQTQEQLMLQLEQGTCTDCVPVLEQTREMLQLQLRTIKQEIPIPDELQNQTQTQEQDQTQNQLRIHQTPQPTSTSMPPYGTCTPVMDGSGQQNGSGSPSLATPVSQQNQTQQQNQNQQRNQDDGQTQKGNGSGGDGSGGGSSTGSGGQGGKP